MPIEMRALNLNVLLLREPIGDSKECWVMQCLEYDIAAQGQTLKQVKNCFMQLLQTNIILALRRGVEPLSNFKPAPEQYWEMWKESAEGPRNNFPISVPGDRIPKEFRDLSRIPRAEASMRLAEAV